MPIDDADVHALDVLREIYEVGDPVPPSLLDRVKFAITLDDLEAEVARLQREAVPELAEARSEDLLKAQTVTFTSEALTTMVTSRRWLTGGCGWMAGRLPAAGWTSSCAWATSPTTPSPTRTAGSSSRTWPAVSPSSCSVRAATGSLRIA